MAVQQRRVSKSRKNQRRAHDALTINAATKCKECGKTIKPHRICKFCGFYKDEKVISG